MTSTLLSFAQLPDDELLAAVKRLAAAERCATAALLRSGRCTERNFLEYHHVQPYAAGGAATAANIQLRCRFHNAYEAMLFFGDDAAEPIDDRLRQ